MFNIEDSLTIMRSFFLLSCLPAWEPSYASCIHGIKRTTRVGCTSYIAVFTRLSVDNELRKGRGRVLVVFRPEVREFISQPHAASGFDF